MPSVVGERSTCTVRELVMSIAMISPLWHDLVLVVRPLDPAPCFLFLVSRHVLAVMEAGDIEAGEIGLRGAVVQG